MELTNVSAELKTSTSQVTAFKTETEKLKREQQALMKELEDTKTKMDEQLERDQLEKDKKDNMISKLRTLAKKYKGNY